ncbi:MAG: TonB-dependent receptor [Pseudomonadota bacterium]
MTKRLLVLSAVLALAATSFNGNAVAQAVCPGGASARAEVLSIDGNVRLVRGGSAVSLSRGTPLCPGDELSTGEAAGADIRFADKDSVVNVLSSSIISIPADEAVDMSLSSGLMRFISSVTGSFRIRTPQADAGIDGTEAMLAVDGPAIDTLVLVREGVVRVIDRRADGLELLLAAGEASYNAAGQTLVRATPENVPEKFRGYLLNPAGAADWAVYYPPVLLASGIENATVQRAAALLDAGQPDAAESLLAGYSGPDRAAALALGAMTAIYRNRTAEGLERARQAVATDSGLGAGHVALSYALQASGEVTSARRAAETAVQVSPEDVYAWARLAELALTLGDTASARGAAEQSLSIAETSLAHAVLGFAELSETDRPAARDAFEKAIALDTEAPLPRLGLGLAAIGEGDLAAGRQELETAASLDPQRAQLRGWLGRAYLEEGRPEKAAAQFELAKEQDPDDPTPWLFSALERFSANQPVTALRDLQEAEKRGEARATVRGRDGLGEDAAVRNTAAGRIYDVLGFEQQAAQEGARAVKADPTNPGAHRFLADVYRAQPGFEIAQNSELLTAQLLSPPSQSPVQPRLSEPDLGLLNTSGPARVTFQEFAPIFDGDGVSFIASGGAGTQGFHEDEVSLSIKDGHVSLAVGQFHTATDGFRPNDDVRHDIVSVEAKIQPVPWLTLTTEVRARETDEGDRFLRAFDDPNAFIEQRETERIQLTLGAHAELGANNDLLFFGAVAQEDQFFESDQGPFIGIIEADVDIEGFTAEVQNITRFDWGHLLVGGTFTKSTEDSTLTTISPFFGSFTTPADVRDVDHASLYAYTFVEPVDWLDLTLGLSLDRAQRVFVPGSFGVRADETFKRVNPKAGVEIEPIDGVRLRAAYAETLKRELVQDRTLEPTTIAGFNQFFDDFEQTDSQLIGGGLDVRVLDIGWLGGEFIYRELDTPERTVANARIKGREKTARAYFNTTFGDNWAGSLGFEYVDSQTGQPDRPDLVRTFQIPVSVRYFDQSGFFAGAEAIWFDQESTGAEIPVLGLLDVDTDEQGFVLNAVAGYRFPNNRGIISLELNNILDQSFALQNNLSNSARPGTRPLAEEFSVIGRVTLGFN